MIAYEIARVLPPTWHYEESALFSVVVATAVVAVLAPFGTWALRHLLACVGRTCDEAPSLPASPVKPRLA
jgi:hypothetical protein